MQLAPKTAGWWPRRSSAAAKTSLLVAAERRARRGVTPSELPLVARDRKGSSGIKLEAADELGRLVVLPS